MRQSTLSSSIKFILTKTYPMMVPPSAVEMGSLDPISDLKKPKLRKANNSIHISKLWRWKIHCEKESDSTDLPKQYPSFSRLCSSYVRACLVGFTNPMNSLNSCRSGLENSIISLESYSPESVVVFFQKWFPWC